jgi:4-amino-4-deoxy-L-arabinose transferase-like glycosyltransferase
LSELNPARPPRWAILVLGAILVFDVWLRAHTFGPTVRDRLGLDLWPVTGAASEPLDCDECAYAYIGRRITHGAVMYRDLTENKPPGGYWIYTLAVALGGSNELTIRLMPIPMVLATIALVWWIALRLRGPGSACLAALIYAVASTDPYLFGNGSNFEHAINLFSTASLALLVAPRGEPGPRRLLATGACLGMACLIKQVVILNAALFALYLVWPARKPRAPFRAVAALAGGFALVWVTAAVVLIAQGAGASAYEDIIRYGSALATDTPPDPNAPPRWVRWVTGNADPTGHLPWPFGRTNYLVWWGTGSWPLWLAAVPALLTLGLARGATPQGRLTAAWTLSAWVQVALPGLFWQHYYLLPLPGLAVAVAALLGASLERARQPGLRRVAWAAWAGVLVLALLWTARIQVRDYLLNPPETLTVEYKGGRQWVALRSLGRLIARRTRTWDDPHLFVWGWQSPLFFYSGLDGVSRHFFADPLLKAYADRPHPLIQPRIERIMRDLEAHPPELIFAGDPPFPALARFLSKGYFPSRLVPTAPDGRGLWVARSKYGEFEASRETEASPR